MLLADFAGAFDLHTKRGSAASRVLENVRIPMRDGIALVGDIRMPRATGRYPTIVEVTPYDRKRDGHSASESPYWVERGYVFVIADTRGQGASQGTFDFFRTDINDNYDVVEWIAAQPWSNGKVGMRGSSYTGANQWYAAKNRPPHLTCITPNAVAARPMEELPRNGGAFKLRWTIEWAMSLSDSGVSDGGPIRGGRAVDYQAALEHRPLLTLDELLLGRPSPLYRRFLEHDTLDEYWRPIQYTEMDFRRVDIPSLAMSGWFDGTLPGTIFYYTHMKRYSPADDKQFLIIGPWEHMTLSEGGHDWRTGQKVTQIGAVTIPDNGFLAGQEITRAFFDWCLKGEGSFDQPSAKVYVTGSNHWLDLPQYPPPRDLRPLYLHSDGKATLKEGGGRLSWQRPADEPADHYVYDPANPVPEYILDASGKRIRLQSMPVDIAQVNDRPDVLVYESEPLAEPVTVIGNVVLMLHAASDARDTDFTSHIADVWPDGRAIKLGPQSGGIIRARYRNGFDKEELLTPGKSAEFKIDYFDIGHTFLPGHRIRVSVTSSNYPWVSANPNTGNPIATDTAAPRKARQTIYHDRARPSHLLLPVVSRHVLDAYRSEASAGLAAPARPAARE